MREMTDIEKQVERAIPVVRAKAEQAALEAIGKEFSVRIDRRIVQHGTIERCWVSWVGRRGMAVVALWKVDLVRNGLHSGPIQVSRIPS